MLVVRYTKDMRDVWDAYVRDARNGYFLFLRDYMDYHSDRFEDHSLLFYKEEPQWTADNHRKVFAILPANQEGTMLVSHRGLTFGGLLMDWDVTAPDVIELFRSLNGYLRTVGITRVRYTPVPWVYHRHASEEDLYPLHWVCHAQVVKRDMGSVIFMKEHPAWWRGRRYEARKARKAGVTVVRTEDFRPFWKVLEENLLSCHGVKPVHTVEEMELLHGRFPRNIVLYNAMYEGECIAGYVFYLWGNVVHGQYCSASPLGKKLGAMDAMYEKAIFEDFADYEYFDFGRSTEGDGSYLNESLIKQKEGYGARGVVYDTYEFTVL